MPQIVRLKEAVHHVLRSPFVRNMGTVFWTMGTEGWTSGWRAAFEKMKSELDLTGEGHACGVLGLEAGCLQEFSDVKRAHRKLALEYHPDKQAGGSEDEQQAAAGRFREVQEAYEHLSKIKSEKKAADEGRDTKREAFEERRRAQKEAYQEAFKERARAQAGMYEAQAKASGHYRQQQGAPSPHGRSRGGRSGGSDDEGEWL